MLNQNQNRYKFTSRPSSTSNQSQTTTNSSNYPQQNYYQNRNQFKEPPKIQPEIVIDDKDDDDDLLDISDTELIRASQAVESQLKFTNNIHQTTSNAITIFSQITSNTQQQPMAPPQLQHTTTYSTSNYNNYDSIDDIKYEIKQLKNENMQKDGEVKILRDKLKRLEQETQKIRNEKFDLVKKLQQQHEDAKKSLQKHMEFKDLESQFKSQELMEITMKYKVLQSSILKNSNNQQQLQPQQQQQQSVLSSSTPSNQKIQQPKTSLPTKRAATAQTTNINTSDTENDNPSDTKRPRQQTPKIIAPLKTKIIFKRNQVLNTKSSNTISTPSDLIYKLTDKLSEIANLLSQINQGKTSLNSVDFQQKLHNLNTYLKMAFSSKLKVTNTERIDYISDKLNEELIKLLKNNLDLILVHIDLNQIDLNCSLIQTLFRLFLIRFDLLIDTNNTMVDLKLLNKLKQQFFLVLSQCLESLNFNTLNKLMFSDNNNKKNQNLLAYWSLKIFINLFDLINYLNYLPLNVKNPKKQIYYVALADNLHSIFKNLSLVGDMNNRSNGHVDEDDTCLLQLFYDKLNKFFSDVLYLLETSENRQNNLDQPVSKELEIITTIVDESKNSKIDFKLENRISENYLMNSSLSECDNDIFQSQVDPSVITAQLPEPPVLTTINHQNIKPIETIPTVNSFNPDLSQLKLECFTKFAYLIHNYQFINSLETKFKANSHTESEIVTEESSCKKRKIYQSMSNLNQINNNATQMTHNESCACFKEMLNSYLCLIDYQFGDKLTNDHNLYAENSLDLKDNLDLLLLMVGFNSYVTVANIDKYSKSVINSESIKRKLSVLDAISEDYRLKNFFSLFNLFDRTLNKNDVDKMQIDEDLNNNSTKSHHLNNSFNSLRLYFKSYVDDYFDFTQN